MEKIITFKPENLQKLVFQNNLTFDKLSDLLSLPLNTITDWFNKNIRPEPGILFKLAQLLKTQISEFVTVTYEPEPIIAFRKRATCKITEKHISAAKSQGIFLAELTKLLFFHNSVDNSILENPTNDYQYIKSIVYEFRKQYKLGYSINFSDLIKTFSSFRAVVIPSLFGKKEKHHNAIHIYLPDSKITWIFLNLDVNLLDFKFWMAHEMGHIKGINLIGQSELSEDFADSFAGELLFPFELSKTNYRFYMSEKNNQSKINFLLSLAAKYEIALYTIYRQIQKYADFTNQSFIELDKKMFFTASHKINSKFKTITELLFGKENPSIKEYISTSKKIFKSQFFDCLKKHISNGNTSAGYIANAMNISNITAQAIYDELANSN